MGNSTRIKQLTGEAQAEAVGGALDLTHDLSGAFALYERSGLSASSQWRVDDDSSWDDTLHIRRTGDAHRSARRGWKIGGFGAGSCATHP